MQFPIAISVGGQSINLHGILEALGIFVAFRYYLYLKKVKGDLIPTYSRTWIVVAAALGAVLGARIVGSLENIPEWTHSPDKLAYFLGNKTLVGGLLGGLAGVEIAKAIMGERRNTGDLFVYPLILGMIIGRIGCFSVGVQEETYGVTTTLPFGMDLGDGIYRHPVTLYEIVWLIIVWITIRAVSKRYVLANGALFKLFMIAYLAFRFLLDFIKPGWRYFLGMGTIQLACIAGLIYYGRYLLRPSLLLAVRGDAYTTSQSTI